MDAVSEAIQRSRADVADLSGPIASFMFLGPTGELGGRPGGAQATQGALSATYLSTCLPAVLPTYIPT